MKAVNFDGALVAAKNPVSEVNISIATNQANSVCSYAAGKVNYRAGFLDKQNPPARTPAALTSGESGIEYLFSDRQAAVAIGATATGGLGGKTITQPFNIKEADKLGVTLTRRNSTTVHAKFELKTWGSAFELDLKEVGDVLMGVGPPVGHSVSQAVYLVAFTLGSPPK